MAVSTPWAEPAGLGAAHGRADTVGLGLVAGREHDTRTHDHGAAAQAWVVSLLNRREECVDVRVQNRPRARHEHMFA
jgi:hypothetical protein